MENNQTSLENNNSGMPQYHSVPPKNWLIESVLATLFCCMPLGIAGIVFAAKVDGLHAAGDFAGAEKAAADAKKFTLWSVLSIVVIFAVVLLMGLFGALVEALSQM